MAVSVETRSLPERAFEVLRQAGNPFRNYFARNPDDEVCARYHVPELFTVERDQLLGVVDLYRYDRTMHSEMVPILGNKGSGKTHLLYSIKHCGEGGWQLLVTPGTYHKDTDFLEYLLFQTIDTLLGGGTQKGGRPLQVVGEALTRALARNTLEALQPAQRLELFPAPGLGRWARRLGLGASQAQERSQWLLDQLGRVTSSAATPARSMRRLCDEAGIDPERLVGLTAKHLETTEAHDTAGLMRRQIYYGFVRATLMADEAELANFLTYGFAELDFQVRPTRQDLVLALFKVLMQVFLHLKIPVVVAFDQLEDLLLARRTDDGHRVAEAFFAGIVQAMHQIDGICFLVFAERGLWNRFVPSLDGYIQDRLNNPIHLPRHGTVKTLRLEAPAADLVYQIVAARLRPALEELSDGAELAPIFPFTDEQITRVAKTEPTLRDMLQQFRHLFDHLVFHEAPSSVTESALPKSDSPGSSSMDRSADFGALPGFKSVIVVETPAVSADSASVPENPERAIVEEAARPSISWAELWEREMRAARRQLEPDGALTGATRELQAGLGQFLQVAHEHGAKVGPWRVHHVVNELAFGEHPTYGVLTIAHWVCRDGQPWRVGVGLFLGRGPGKPKDLEIKLAAMNAEPPIIDHLILLRPEDDLALSGKSKALWQEAARRGRQARLEPMSLDDLAALYGFPRWLAAITESMPQGQPLPNLAEFIQEHADSLLQKACMPIQQ